MIGTIGYPPNVQPHPSGFEAGGYSEWAFFVICGAAVVALALPWAIRCALRRDFVPVLVILSALICSLVEPMLDMLGHLHWADDLTFLYANFGVPIPLLIPPCYIAFLGLKSYFCYVVIKNGAKQSHFYMLLVTGIVFDAVMETIGINLGVFMYYGYQPYSFLGFPYWWGFVNSGSFVTIGVMLWYLVPRLQGWQQLWLLAVAPSGMMISYFGVGWVHILAHNSNIPEWMRLIAATVTMAMMVGYMNVLHHFAGEKDVRRVPNWTLPRMFLYTVMTPTQKQRLLDRMRSEAGLTAGAAAAT